MLTFSKKILFLIIALETTYSQPTLEWARSYNGPSNRYDVANAVKVDDSGYVYVTGHTQSTMTNNYDYCTIKYRPNGDSVWVRILTTVPSGGFDIGRDLEVDNLGNVYVTGTSATIKYDKFGNIIWQDLTPNVFDGKKIKLDNSGNIYVAGYQYPYPGIRKYNNTGTLLWVTTYDTGGGYLSDMELSNNNIIAVGMQGVATRGFFTMKCDSSGNILWTRRYAGNYPNYDEAYALAINNIGDIFVTGRTRDENNIDNFLTFRYDSNGTPIWFRRFSGGLAYDIGIDNTNGIYVTGTSAFDYITIKYDTTGNLLWNRTLSSTFGPSKPTLKIIGSYIYLAHESPRGAWIDMAIIKYDTNGEQQWLARYPGSGNVSAAPYNMQIDNNNNFYCVGAGPGIGGVDYLTVKFSKIIGIIKTSETLPEQFKLYQNYPNPFNPETKIKFQVSKFSNVKLIAYDILGREITVLVNEQLRPGTYELNWNAENQSSGLYFCKLSTEDFQQTIKLTLIK